LITEASQARQIRRSALARALLVGCCALPANVDLRRFA
jgi:hypothetical protein